jgi:transcriptional regulator with XRE-family HTH domain
MVASLLVPRERLPDKNVGPSSRPGRKLAETAKIAPGRGRLVDVDADLNEILATIGPRLRALRRDRGMTLQELSAATAISVSGLSRLESGKRRPTLELLIPLARAHRVALDQLIAAPATGDPRVHLTPRRHRSGSVVVPLTQYPGRLQVFKHVIAPRPRRLVTHAGYEWMFVLAGELLLVLGQREMTLRPGEVAEFDTTEPHWFGPSDDRPVEILHIFGPQGDKARMRHQNSSTFIASS